MDFQARVADHYRSRGYQVRTGTRVRGRSGNVYAVDLVAQGPLGNIVLTFGGTDGLDEGDVAHIKRVGKELGATPVAASERLDPVVRRLAGRESVVVLDSDLPEAVQEPEAVPDDDVQRWAADHPWPDPAKDKRAAATGLDDLLSPSEHTEPTAPAPQPPVPSEQPKERFAWLQQSTGHQGGYAFADARPVPQPDAPTRTARAHRDEVLERVRERFDGGSRGPAAAVATGTADPGPRSAEGEVAHPAASRGANAPPAIALRPTPEWVWILRFSVAGITAGIVGWVLLKFG